MQCRKNIADAGVNDILEYRDVHPGTENINKRFDQNPEFTRNLFFKDCSKIAQRFNAQILNFVCVRENIDQKIICILPYFT